MAIAKHLDLEKLLDHGVRVTAVINPTLVNNFSGFRTVLEKRYVPISQFLSKSRFLSRFYEGRMRTEYDVDRIEEDPNIFAKKDWERMDRQPERVYILTQFTPPPPKRAKFLKQETPTCS